MKLHPGLKKTHSPTLSFLIFNWQTVTLSNLGEEFTPQEMSHLSQVAQRRDTTLSDRALKDYIRIITEEYANARLSGPEGLLQLAQRKKRMEHGG